MRQIDESLSITQELKDCLNGLRDKHIAQLKEDIKKVESFRGQGRYAALCLNYLKQQEGVRGVSYVSNAPRPFPPDLKDARDALRDIRQNRYDPHGIYFQWPEYLYEIGEGNRNMDSVCVELALPFRAAYTIPNFTLSSAVEESPKTEEFVIEYASNTHGFVYHREDYDNGVDPFEFSVTLSVLLTLYHLKMVAIDYDFDRIIKCEGVYNEGEKK